MFVCMYEFEKAIKNTSKSIEAGLGQIELKFSLLSF